MKQNTNFEKRKKKRTHKNKRKHPCCWQPCCTGSIVPPGWREWNDDRSTSSFPSPCSLSLFYLDLFPAWEKMQRQTNNSADHDDVVEMHSIFSKLKDILGKFRLKVWPCTNAAGMGGSARRTPTQTGFLLVRLHARSAEPAFKESVSSVQVISACRERAFIT